MKLNTHPENRKDMVNAISELTEIPSVYMGIRSCFRALIPAVTRSCIAAPLADFWAELRRKSLKGIFRVSADMILT